MNKNKNALRWLRFQLTAAAALAAIAQITWEHFNGGVVSHHILNRADLPAVSNAWGAVLLPVLTWFLVGRVNTRIARHGVGQASAAQLPVAVVVGFLGALLFGVLLSAAFANGYENVSSALFAAMFVLAVLLPVYRAECVLGFVLGMTFTFAAILPTAIGSVIAVVSALVHLCFRPGLVHLWRWLRRPRREVA